MSTQITPLSRPSGELVPNVRRIAVLRANSLGDFVVTIPALTALRTAYPRARITVLGDVWHRSLLCGRPGPWDDVTVVPSFPGLRGQSSGPSDTAETRAFFVQQRRVGYDLAVQLHGGGRNSNPFVSSLGARVTAGARDTDAAPLDRWIRYSGYQHEVQRWLEVVSLVGAPPVQLEPVLTVTGADAEEAANVLPETERALVIIHPGANDPRRRWPPERFAAVARSLVDDGCHLVLVGSEQDASLSAAIAEKVPGQVTDTTGRLALSGLVGVLARASLVIANDSGPRHLAAAVGAATVGVFWCSNALTSAPLSRDRHRLAISFRNRCPDCGDDQAGGRCAHDGSWVADIPTCEILDAARDLLVVAVGSGRAAGMPLRRLGSGSVSAPVR